MLICSPSRQSVIDPAQYTVCWLGWLRFHGENLCDRPGVGLSIDPLREAKHDGEG